jgi:hypothetical protein
MGRDNQRLGRNTLSQQRIFYFCWGGGLISAAVHVEIGAVGSDVLLCILRSFFHPESCRNSVIHVHVLRCIQTPTVFYRRIRDIRSVKERSV